MNTQTSGHEFEVARHSVDFGPRLFFLLTFSIFINGISLANSISVATFKSVIGYVEIGSDSEGVKRKIRTGDFLDSPGSIRTGNMAGATIEFIDGHAVAIGPNSTVKLSEYAFNKSDISKSKIQIELSNGSFRARTGSVGLARPSQVVYFIGKTQIEIRGTEIVAVASTDAGLVGVLEGQVVVIQGKRFPVGAGKGIHFQYQTSHVLTASISDLLRILRSEGQSPLVDFYALAAGMPLPPISEYLISNATTSSGWLLLTPETTRSNGTSGAASGGGGSASTR